MPNPATPKVTIGLPFYNDKSTLLDAVRSVFAQTYSNWELILLDDGSNDGSLGLVRDIADPRVRIVKDGQNKGLVYRLNQLVGLASADLIARMDADDLMHPERLSEQVSYLVANPEVDVVDTAMISLSREGMPEGKRGFGALHQDPNLVIRSAYLLHASVMGKKAWFMNNPYDEAYVRAEDYELWVRTFTFTQFGRIPKALYFVREGKVNLRNYYISNKTLRKIFRTYGPALVSPFRLRLLIAGSYLKVALYRLFGMAGMQHILARKRNNPLLPRERENTLELINKIRETPLPYEHHR